MYKEEYAVLRYLVVGDPGVGKTSLISKYTEGGTNQPTVSIPNADFKIK